MENPAHNPELKDESTNKENKKDPQARTDQAITSGAPTESAPGKSVDQSADANFNNEAGENPQETHSTNELTQFRQMNDENILRTDIVSAIGQLMSPTFLVLEPVQLLLHPKIWPVIY